MIAVTVEVRDGAAVFNVAVRAESIRRAVSLVKARYPGGEVGVKLPIDPESFFVDDAALFEELIGHEMPERMTG